MFKPPTPSPESATTEEAAKATTAAAAATAAKKSILTPALVAVALGVFMMQLDATVVNLALPQIGADLHAQRSSMQWVIDGYTLPLASCLLIGGRLGDRFGHRRVFLAGLALFGAASALCAAAASPSWLIGARVLQGLGAAIELPPTLALLARNYPDPARRARAIGVWASVAGLSLAVGPLVGGPLVDSLGWQSVFLMNLPVVVVAIGLTWRSVGGDASVKQSTLDIPGQLTGTAALVLVTYAVITGQSQGWGLPRVLGSLAASLILLGAFVWVERRASQPLIPPTLLRHGVFVGVNLAAATMGFVLFGLLFAYSLYFQEVHHLSATSAGYRFLPLAVTFILIGPVAGRLRPSVAILLGLGMLGAASAGLAILSTTASYVAIAALFVAIGLGYGLLATNLAAAAVAALPPQQAGLASAMNNTARQLGGVLGVAFAGGQLRLHPTTFGNQTTFVMIGFVIAAAVAVGVFFPLTKVQEFNHA